MNKCAFDRDGVCSALSKKQCVGCHFRKSEQELNNGRAKAARRVSKLPQSIQIHIARKYYDRGSFEND